MLALFVGPDDADSCDGCDDAVNGNPYTEDTVPEPGSFECGTNCRHMVQLGEDAPDDIPTFRWRSSVSFETGESKYYSDRVADVNAPLSLGFTPLQPGYTPLESDDLNRTLVDLGLNPLTDTEIEELQNGDTDDIAQFLFANGISPDDIQYLGNLPFNMGAVMQDYYGVVAGELDMDTVWDMLDSGDTRVISQSAVNDLEFRQMLLDAAAQGFDDQDLQRAYLLGQILGTTPVLNSTDGRWYLK